METDIVNSIYLDNNATTFMPRVVVEELFLWINKGNPSSSHKVGIKCQEKILETKDRKSVV